MHDRGAGLEWADRRTPRRFRGALVGLLTSATSLSLSAQDATVVITQNALNAYAMAIGTVAHSTNVRITYELPDLCRLLAGSGDPTGTLNCPPVREAILAEGTLNWNIQAPRFTVATAGMRFQALLQATFVPTSTLVFSSQVYRSIDSPATISYDNSSKVLILTVASGTIPIEAGGFFGNVVVAYVTPGTYYSTNLSTPADAFAFALPDGDRLVKASVASVQITYGTKQVVLKPTFTIE